MFATSERTVEETVAQLGKFKESQAALQTTLVSEMEETRNTVDTIVKSGDDKLHLTTKECGEITSCCHSLVKHSSQVEETAKDLVGQLDDKMSGYCLEVSERQADVSLLFNEKMTRDLPTG